MARYEPCGFLFLRSSGAIQPITMHSGRQLNLREVQREIDLRPGLIPVSIDSDSRRIEWVDLEQYHCYDGSFHAALNAFETFKRGKVERFVTELEVLDTIATPANSLAPTGFIFHAGRCGSTLLAQVLARSRTHMVFGEAPAHSQILRMTHASTADRLCKNLFLAMGRRRLAAYRSHIIKFTSFNILRFQQIRGLFPGVPALFLFRDPDAMLRSYRRDSPPWIGQGMGFGGNILGSAESAVETFFRAALSIGDADFRCLDYARLTPESLEEIAIFLDAERDSRELAIMRDGFLWDARSGSAPKPFLPASSSSFSDSRAAASALWDLYRKLTLWKPLLV